MESNLFLIILAAVSQFVLGALWYSPLLFGKLWMSIVGAEGCSEEEKKAMQKQMTPFYALQFLITVLYTFVLNVLLVNATSYDPYAVALLVWLGFVVPIQVSGVIWGGTKKVLWVKQICIMTSYQLVGILIATFILSV